MKLRLLLLSVCLVSPGCQNGLPELSLPTITMPRIGFGEPQEPAIPISVAYAFDPSVTEAQIETQACGLPYTLNTGEIIPQAFLAVGHKRFQSVSAYEGTSEAVREEQTHDLTIQINMIHHSLKEADRMAEEDNYLVFVDLQLQAVFVDRDGTQLAQLPLHFNDQMTVWAPALTGQSVSCATGQYDGTISNAAQALASQLASVVPELLTNGSPQSPAVAGQPTTPATPPTTPLATLPAAVPAVPLATPPPLTFRTRLTDANDNLILEGGETIVLEIEATYAGTSALAAAHANLDGSAIIVEAFSSVTTLPVSLGTFQPGETKTTEIRGRMPLTVREPTGELVITLTPDGEGTSIGSHRIIAPLQAGGSTLSTPNIPAAESQTEKDRAATSAPSTPNIPTAEATDTDKRPDRQTSSSQETRSAEAYAAILIGMDAYRGNWPDGYRTPAGHMETMRNVLHKTGMFTEQNIQVLKGDHAAKSDVEEALFTWGRQRIGTDSVLLVYFSGQAIKNPATGEVYLVPYEGSPDASPNRLISLRSLQRALGAFDNRLTLLLLDTPLIPSSNPASNLDANQSKPVRWDSGLPRQDSSPTIQIRNIPGRGSDNFAGLLISTDANRIITVGEFLDDAAQMGEVIPALPDSSPVSDILLTREATAETEPAPAPTTPVSVPDSSPVPDTPAETDTQPAPTTPAPTSVPDDIPELDTPAEINAEPAPTPPAPASVPDGIPAPDTPAETNGEPAPAAPAPASVPDGTPTPDAPAETNGEPASTPPAPDSVPDGTPAPDAPAETNAEPAPIPPAPDSIPDGTPKPDAPAETNAEPAPIPPAPDSIPDGTPTPDTPAETNAEPAPTPPAPDSIPDSTPTPDTPAETNAEPAPTPPAPDSIPDSTPTPDTPAETNAEPAPTPPVPASVPDNTPTPDTPTEADEPVITEDQPNVE